MKKRNALPGILFLVLSVVAGAASPNQRETQTAGYQSEMSSRQTAIIGQSTESGHSGNEQAHELVLKTADGGSSDMGRYYRAAFPVLPRLKFWYRIVDQKGKPVAGARVWIETTGTFLSPGANKWFTADKEGYIRVTMKGAKAMIRRIEGPGVNEARYEGAPDRTVWDNTVRRYKDKVGAKTVKVWRQQQYDKSIRESSLGGIHEPGISDAYGISHAGGFYAVDSVDDPHVVLILTCERTPRTWRKFIMTPKGERYYHPTKDLNFEATWSFTLEVRNGGIQEAPESDFFLNEAPETGYKPKVVYTGQIVKRKSYEDYGGESHKERARLYLKTTTPEGQALYASLYFDEIRPFAFRRGCQIDARAKLNPKGGRNLALPPPVYD